jgi:competence protein ComEC
MRALLKAALARPIFCLALGLCLGIAPLLRLPSWALAFLALLAFLSLAYAVVLLRKGRESGFAVALLLLGVCLGALRSQSLARLLAEPSGPSLPAARVTARVVEDLELREESGRHGLLLDRLRVQDLKSGATLFPPGRARLSFSPGSETALGPGDLVEFLGALHPCDPPSNPGEFDYRAFLLGRGVLALASSRHAAQPRLLESGSLWNPWRLAWRARRAMIGDLERSLSKRGADLTRGMVLGDTGGLTKQDMSVYSRTGIVHILSVSGLHFALALAIFLWAGKLLGMSRRALARLALPLAVAYAMICGLPVPCQRSLSLFALVLLGQALDLDTDIVTSLAFGAVLVLMIQPGAVFEAGAQLSFVVSLGLVTLTPVVEKRLPLALPSWLRLGVAGTLAAEATSVPLVAWHFGIFCWPALVATALTAPLMGPIVGLGLATGLLGALAPALALLSAWPLEWLIKALDFVSGRLAWLPYAAFSVGRPSVRWMLSALALTLLFALWPRRWLLFLAGALLGWLLWPGLPWAHRHPGLTKTWFFSVGQGDASLTEFEDGRTLLVDAGPINPDAGSWVVGPALRRLGVNQIDWAVVTHPHADHLGGMFWILRQFPVKLLLHSGALERQSLWLGILKTAREMRVPLSDLSQEASPKDWEGRITKLAPKSPRLEKTKHDMHNNNVVLRVGNWLLLMGDMQKEGEQRLLREGGVTPCDVLKLGHHGSRTSTTPAFLAAVNPRACVIQAGARNLYRHPSVATLKTLAGRQIYRNDLQGCIFVEHDALGCRLEPWRQIEELSLWQAPPKQKRFPWKTVE